MSIHTSTGCRPAQFLGLWAMEQSAYDALMDQADLVIASGNYEIVARDSKEMAEKQEKDKGYVTENGIAKFQLNGPMTRFPTSMQSAFGGTSTLMLQRAVRNARRDGFVSGGFMEISSPGGTVEGLEDLCAELAAFRSAKPLRMHVSGDGCSAAYRAGVESDAMTVDPMGITGSIGTLTRLRDTSKMMERVGVKDHWIASGDKKTAGAPGTVVTEEQIAERKALVDAINKSFLSAVESRRPRTKEHMADISRAGLYDAHRAVQIGLADAVMTTDAAFEQFAQRIPFGSGRTLPG